MQAVRRALAEGRMVLGGFRTIIRAEDGRPLAFMTAHQLVKTYYIPALLRPLSFLRCRLRIPHDSRLSFMPGPTCAQCSCPLGLVVFCRHPFGKA